MQLVGKVQRRRAAHPRAVVVDLPIGVRFVHAVDLAAAHAVDQGDIADTGRPCQCSVSPVVGQRQQADHLRQRDHFGQFAVAVFALARLVGLEAGRHHDRPDIQFKRFWLVLQVQPGAVDLQALATAVAVLPVNGRQCRDSRRDRRGRSPCASSARS